MEALDYTMYFNDLIDRLDLVLLDNLALLEKVDTLLRIQRMMNTLVMMLVLITLFRWGYKKWQS